MRRCDIPSRSQPTMLRTHTLLYVHTYTCRYNDPLRHTYTLSCVNSITRCHAPLCQSIHMGVCVSVHGISSSGKTTFPGPVRHLAQHPPACLPLSSQFYCRSSPVISIINSLHYNLPQWKIFDHVTPFNLFHWLLYLIQPIAIYLPHCNTSSTFLSHPPSTIFFVTQLAVTHFLWRVPSFILSRLSWLPILWASPFIVDLFFFLWKFTFIFLDCQYSVVCLFLANVIFIFIFCSSTPISERIIFYKSSIFLWNPFSRNLMFISPHDTFSTFYLHAFVKAYLFIPGVWRRLSTSTLPDLWPFNSKVIHELINFSDLFQVLLKIFFPPGSRQSTDASG